MPVPSWFDAHFLEAREANHPVDYAHLGEQCGLRIEELIPLKSMKEWWALSKEWKESKSVEEGELGEMDRKIISFLERECPDCMAKIPEDQRAAFLRGLWKKKG